MKCIDELRALWCRIERSGKKNGNNATWFHFLGELLLLLDQQKTLILSDEKFLPSLFASTLGSSCHNILVPQNMENRFDQPTKERILEFILGSALKFSNYGKGVGYAIMHPNIAPVLSRSIEQYYDDRSKSRQKISNTRTKIMCLLLESCVMSSPSGGDDLQDPLLKTLQLDDMTSDDPAYIEPCISVLNKLNSHYQSSPYYDLNYCLFLVCQEDLFRAVVFLCRSANGDVQRATKEALMRIDINFSIVGHILDLILAPKCGIVRSADEKTKKRQKLTTDEEA